MEIEDFKKLQKEFDDKYIGPYNDLPGDLLFLTTALAGEVGEFANLVKKYYRLKAKEIAVNGEDQRDYIADMRKEIIDVYCYFLIIANQLDLDIEEEFKKNLERNKNRFQKIGD
ncbi:MazG nucleotide pyrophosphohydrolase domain-containing protein [Patescibacteria group bacterium]